MGAGTYKSMLKTSCFPPQYIHFSEIKTKSSNSKIQNQSKNSLKQLSRPLGRKTRECVLGQKTCEFDGWGVIPLVTMPGSNKECWENQDLVTLSTMQLDTVLEDYKQCREKLFV